MLITIALFTACVRKEQPTKPFMIVKKDSFSYVAKHDKDFWTCRYTYISNDGHVLDFFDTADKYNIGDMIE